MKSPDREMIIQFTPFDYKEKPAKPDPAGNEEYKMYERIINRMFVKT